MKRLLYLMNPSVDPSTEKEMDLNSLKSIQKISLIALIFEIMAGAAFLISVRGNLDADASISVVSVSFSIVLCAAAFLLSAKLLKNESFPHSWFAVFKAVFYVAFTASSILFDFRNYRAGDQMVTFHIVNLIMTCFILFRPWIGAVLVSCSYLGLFFCLYTFDGAAHIQPLNLLVLALASISSSVVRYHRLLAVSSNTVRLFKDNLVLENISRHDALTGLLNRLALEDDAHKTDGREMTVYMVDINYFKEINDEHGHVIGDAILRETSETLRRLYPGGSHYRYGGDEFLVITYCPAEENHAADTYAFTQAEHGVDVLLSIGSAKGSPADYHELFELISLADKSLYMVKQRTHSVEFGGHGNRKA